MTCTESIFSEAWVEAEQNNEIVRKKSDLFILQFWRNFFKLKSEGNLS